MEPAAASSVSRYAKRRLNMAHPNGPADVEVWEITADAPAAHSHIYMETPVFTPDSKRFIFRRLQNPNETGSSRLGPLCLCDTEDGFSIRVLTDGEIPMSCVISQDGSHAYYTVERREGEAGGHAALKRVNLATGLRETVIAMDRPLSGYDVAPYDFYPIASTSLDGTRIASACKIGRRGMANPPWGIVIFDLVKAEARIILEGEDWCNAHPQYGLTEEFARDVMVQHNHGAFFEADGTRRALVSGFQCDIHLIHDDGTDFRSFPWGRDGHEACQGHQCFRGETGLAVTATSLRLPSGDTVSHLAEGRPLRGEYTMHHRGIRMQNASENRNNLSRLEQNPRFSHFAFDKSGTRLITDWIIGRSPASHKELDILQLGVVGLEKDATIRNRPFLRTLSSFQNQQTHPHPAFSPDGQSVIFNSDANGLPQIFLARITDEMFDF